MKYTWRILGKVRTLPYFDEVGLKYTWIKYENDVLRQDCLKYTSSILVRSKESMYFAETAWSILGRSKEVMYFAKTAWSILEVYLDLLRKWCTWPRLLQVYFKYTWSSTYFVKYVSSKALATGAEAVLPRSILEVYLDQVRKLFISPRQLQVYLENTWRSTYLAK